MKELCRDVLDHSSTSIIHPWQVPGFCHPHIHLPLPARTQHNPYSACTSPRQATNPCGVNRAGFPVPFDDSAYSHNKLDTRL